MSNAADGAASAVRMSEWQDNPAKQLVAKLALPVSYLLNRPSMRWFGKGVFDFALRFNTAEFDLPVLASAKRALA